uniref:Uncharacterized protein n=1 Tax=Anopheles coluzzii TaxID=1518534 RepID=A0A8W7PQ88_ANOCL
MSCMSEILNIQSSLIVSFSILGQNERFRVQIETGAVEPHQMVVLDVLHALELQHQRPALVEAEVDVDLPIAGQRVKILGSRLGVQIEQGIIRYTVAVRVYRHVAGNALKASAPHQLGQVRTVDGLPEGALHPELRNAVIEGVRVQQYRIPLD